MKKTLTLMVVAMAMWALGAGSALGDTVAYCDYDATTGKFTNAEHECTLVTSETQKLANGWYAVKENVTISGRSLVVQGDVHLILCDGAELKVENPGSNKAAIHTTGATLTIYGQTSGSGKLTAKGGMFGAGIGGGQNGAGGIVTINGGTVEATGGMHGAGIGGGNGGGNGGAGGTVTINGGMVTATGGDGGAGIGGGDLGSGGELTINGGAVIARAGNDATDIGPGAYGSGGEIQITGGIFGMNLLTDWIPTGYAAFENPDATTQKDYQWKVSRSVTVTLEGGLPLGLAVAWTIGEGKRVNVNSASFAVPLVLSDNLKVFFRPKTGYWFADGLTEKVYTSEGPLTQDFTIPKESIPIPLPYRQVSSGDVETFGDKTYRVKVPKGAYVDTAICPNQDTSVVMDVRVDGALEYWFGCWDRNYNDGAFAFGNDGNGIYAGYGNQGGTFGSVVAAGRHTVELTNRWVKVDGAVVREFNAESGFNVNYPLFLFAQDRSGSAYVPNNQGAIYCYGCQIFTKRTNGDSVLARNLVPARLKIGDKEVGFYDTVNSLFFVSCGEKPFELEHVVIVNIGQISHMTAYWTSDGSPEDGNAISGTFFEVPYGAENVKVTFVPNGLYSLNGDAVINLNKVTKDVTLGVDEVPSAPEAVLTFGQIDYLDWDGDQKKLKTVTRLVKDCEIVNADTLTFEDGKWYVVVEDIASTAEITVNGTANLILMDGMDGITLTVNGGIRVEGQNAINIYGQSGCTGKLIAMGGENGAGIGGGGENGAGGTVTINGGVVTANGGDYAAGIGGGNKGDGGTVIINGGTVTATGNVGGAGVGGGLNGAGGTVTINGGTVTATGGGDGAGIGGGYGGADGTVTPGEKVKVVEGEIGNNSKYVKFVEKWVIITVGTLENMTAEWTSSDESVKNAIEGVSFKVEIGTTGVKVIFTPEHNYRFVNVNEDGIRELDTPLKESCTVTPPEVEAIPGTVINPWSVGADVTAYVSDEGTLVIGGSGAMTDFASAAAVPWHAVANAITAVTIGAGVTKVGKNALSALADTVTVNETPLSTYRKVTTVSINGMTLEEFNEKTNFFNIDSDMRMVSRAEIAAAEAEAVKVAGGG